MADADREQAINSFHAMSFQDKVKYIFHYHKWHFVFAIVLVIALVTIFHDIAENVNEEMTLNIEFVGGNTAALEAADHPDLLQRNF